MGRKQINFVVKGMNKDTSESKFSPEYAYDIRNLRLTTTDNNTQLSLVNEKGTSIVPLSKKVSQSLYTTYTIKGIVLGSCLIRDYLVLFTHLDTYNNYYNYDTIIRLKYNYSRTTPFLEVKELYADGDLSESTYNSLGFSTTHPIETLGIYESDDIIKVYWTDGINQPRMINILEDTKSNFPTQFDFVPEVFYPECNITRIEDGMGQFPSGTLQYFLTYSQEHGQETPLIYISPLLYTTFNNRAGSAEEYTNASYKLTITNLSDKYDNLNIYSCTRTSLSGTNLVKKVYTTKIQSGQTSFTFTDNNTLGSDESSTSLLFKGGDKISAYTLESKDNTLFLGNIIQLNSGLPDTLVLDNTTTTITSVTDNSTYKRTLNDLKGDTNTFYPFKNLPAIRNDFKYLKAGNYYRLGIQAQDECGKWSEVKFLRDFQAFDTPHYLNNDLVIPTYKIELNSTQSSLLIDRGFKRIRPVVVYPNTSQRETIAQGIVNPTLFIPYNRQQNTPYASSSWFFRPYNVFNGYDKDGDEKEDGVLLNYSSSFEGRFNHRIGTWRDNVSNSTTVVHGRNKEIDGGVGGEYSSGDNKDTFYIDNSLVTFNSPDITEDTPNSVINDSHVKFRITGYFFLDSGSGTYSLSASQPRLEPNESTSLPEYVYGTRYDQNVYYTANNNRKYNVLCNVPLWKDTKYWSSSYDNYVKYMICPWQRDGYLNDGYDNEEDVVNGTATYTKKVFSNIRISQTFKYFTNGISSSNDNRWYAYEANSNSKTGITTPILNLGTYNDLSKLDLQTNSDYRTSNYDKLNYLGSLNTLFTFTRSSDYVSQTTNRTSYRVQFMPEETDAGKGFVKDKITTDTTSNINYWKVDNVRVKYKSTPHVVFAFNGGIANVEENKTYHRSLPYPTFNSSTIPDYLRSMSGVPSWLNTDYSIGGSNILWTSTEGDITQSPSPHVINIDIWSNSTNAINWYDHVAEETGYTIIKNQNSRYFCAITALADRRITLYAVRFQLASGSSTIYEPYLTAINDTTLGLTGIENSNALYIKENRAGVAGITNNTVYLHNYNVSSPTVYLTDTTSQSVDSYIQLNETPSSSKPEMMWIGELYRTFDNGQTPIGDYIYGDHTNLSLLESHKWLPAGESVALNSTGTSMIINEGDTTFNRWDCLKTVPDNIEDKNQLVEIMSILCESYNDTYGRYDKNRGLESNINIDETNFNLYNKVYENKNDYFTYRTFKLDTYRFPTKITYSLTKTLGEDTDSWTSISLASILDMDGDKGNITAIRKFNNTLFAFQEKAFGIISFNENVAVPTTEGTPIQIANSGKVNGKRYLSTEIGCNNKHTIKVTPSGIYFVDANTRDIYRYGSSLENISLAKGFHSWVVNNFSNRNIWNHTFYNSDAGITLYDPLNKDVLFVTGTECLAYNEILQEFTSFYNYERINSLNVLDNVVLVTRKINDSASLNDNDNIYSLRSGNYNNFFGIAYPYSIEYLVNPNPLTDKIFNNIEFNADSFSTTNTLLNTTFNKIRVYNEYQDTYTVDLVNTRTVSGVQAPVTNNLRQKFRTWRALIPRNSGTMDRIRNPWTYIKLSKANPSTEMTKLHNVIVDYFE